MTDNELHSIIQGCIALNRQSQQLFYSRFYGFAASISMRYTNSQDEMVEIVNDGFLKVFRELHAFKPVYSNEEISLKGWIKRIMINTAIDYYRKYHKHHQLVDSSEDAGTVIKDHSETSLDKLSYEEILKTVQKLSPAYRLVFSLYVIDGLSHDEISKQLGISVGTSKSNLSKARINLKKMLAHANSIVYE